MPDPTTADLPELPYAAWEPTKAALHLVAQIVGKTALALHPKQPHWWHATLRMSPRGVTTAAIPMGDRSLEIGIDLHALALEVTTSDGPTGSVPLQERSIAEVDASLRTLLAQLGHPVDILSTPYDMPHSEVPFPKDTAPRTYDVDALARFARILRFVHDAFETFAGRSFVRTSPVHLFWHSFDVAVTRFSGRRAPTFGEGERRSDVEAYSHEVVSFGFWPGDPQTRFPAFYSYAAPEPEGLTAHALAPAAAAWQELPSSHLALLAYDDVRTAPEPREALLAFLESAWQAGARAGKWPALEEEDTRPLWDALDAQFPLTRGRERR